MPKKPMLHADKLDCLHCGDLQTSDSVYEKFEETGNEQAVTMHCTSCNGKLIARYSINGFYTFNIWKDKWSSDYQAKRRLKNKKS